jgi:hypothetical protein
MKTFIFALSLFLLSACAPALSQEEDVANKEAAMRADIDRMLYNYCHNKKGYSSDSKAFEKCYQKNYDAAVDKESQQVLSTLQTQAIIDSSRPAYQPYMMQTQPAKPTTHCTTTALGNTLNTDCY